MSTATASTNQHHSTPEPEALRRYLLSLSFPFVEVAENDDEAYGLEPPVDDATTYAPEPLEDNTNTNALQSSWIMPSLTNSASSSAHSSMPATPVLTPALAALPLPDDHKMTDYFSVTPTVKDYFSEHEQHTMREKILAWGVNHLHALEAFVHPNDETPSTTCHPAPKTTSILEDEHAYIEPAYVGAQVRFLIRPMPPRHEEAHSGSFSPLLAAVAGGLFGYGDSDELLADEEYELAEDVFGME